MDKVKCYKLKKLKKRSVFIFRGTANHKMTTMKTDNLKIFKMKMKLRGMKKISVRKILIKMINNQNYCHSTKKSNK